MLVIKAGFEHGRRFCYFPTPLEPSPCDSPPLHPGKLSAWTAANKNSPVRGKWGPASARRSWWGDTSLCISSSRPPPPLAHHLQVRRTWPLSGERPVEVNVAEEEVRRSEVEASERTGGGRGREEEVRQQEEAATRWWWCHWWRAGLKHLTTSGKWFLPKCFGLCVCLANHWVKDFAQQ